MGSTGEVGLVGGGGAWGELGYGGKTTMGVVTGRALEMGDAGILGGALAGTGGGSLGVSPEFPVAKLGVEVRNLPSYGRRSLH